MREREQKIHTEGKYRSSCGYKRLFATTLTNNN